MVRIAPVRLAYNPRTLWFDPGELELHKEDPVVVSTARGTEFGRMADDVFEADEAQVKKLKTALKPVVRLASEEDEERAGEMEYRSAEALPVFKQMAAEASEDMHPVSVEFLLDGDKAVFYFEAEERVDFRDLVRKLAAQFHVRIDMRQIGVRDEARMVGGLGHCGQELCCKRLGGEFCPVSIRMAKEQDLSLNPQKISGVCGRLMCCLRYEFDAYKDFKSRAPKQNAQVETPLGTAKVIDLDVPREVVTLKVGGEKPVKVPLADFDPPEEGVRPNRVGDEAWEDATTQAAMGVAGEATFLTSQFTSQDKLADPASVRRTGSGGKDGSKGRGGSGKGTQANGSANGGGNGGRGGNGAGDGAASESRKPRRRRSTKVAADGSVQQVAGEEKDAKRKPQPRGGSNAPSTQKRSGQKKQGGQGQGNAKGGGNGAQGQSGQARRGGKDQGGQGAAKSGPRPGQKSSGLRQQNDGAAPSGSAPSAGGEATHRRRRRSHRSGGTPGAEGGGES
ncbi:PSP1 domain-containing protein [Gordonibacter sp.]|uniref:PSP1 domain-containing protein n=1 Tax=Gordonibacter sp. TaxID=1968902 RepID=UPI002FC9FF99